jgi:hypothetical protein
VTHTEVFRTCQHANVRMKIAWCGGLSISFRICLVLYVFRGMHHRRTIPFTKWEVHVNKLRGYSMTTEDWNWIRSEGVIDLEIFHKNAKTTTVCVTLKANPHTPCRSHAAPMSLPCHAVPLRV